MLTRKYYFRVSPTYKHTHLKVQFVDGLLQHLNVLLIKAPLYFLENENCPSTNVMQWTQWTESEWDEEENAFIVIFKITLIWTSLFSSFIKLGLILLF